MAQKVFYRVWYTDFGGIYTYKDFKVEEEARKYATETQRANKMYCNSIDTSLEKHIVETLQIES